MDQKKRAWDEKWSVDTLHYDIFPFVQLVKRAPIDEVMSLAAAAPELYRALEFALNAAEAAIEHHDVSTSTEIESYGLVRKAREIGDAALKKARGET